MAQIDDGTKPGSPFAERDLTSTSIPVSEVVYPSQPRLGIGHLMLWMVGSGLLLAVYRRFFDSGAAGGPDWLPMYQMVTGVIFSTIGGAGVSGLILAASRKLRGGPAFPCQPGHWLLVGMGSVVVLQSAGYLLVWTIEFYGLMSSSSDLMLLAVCPGQVFGLVLYGIACYRVHEPAYWRVLIAGLAAYHGLMGLTYAALYSRFVGPIYSFVSIIFFVGPLCVLGATIVVVIRDRRLAATRDWLHWVGIGAQILTTSFSMLSNVAIRILERLFPMN